MELPQPFETQHDDSSKVIYVQGGRLRGFVFKVTFTMFEPKKDFSSLDIFICPDFLVEHVRSNVLQIFPTIPHRRLQKVREIHNISTAGG